MKVGYIEYLNSFPFWHDANAAPVAGTQYIASTPAKLNSMVHQGLLDISAISAYEYLSHQEEYSLLPDLCINSQGHVRSVLLFSKAPLKELSNSKIHLSSESATSVNLLKIILSENQILNNSYEALTPQHDLHACDSLLLIGDQALQFTSNEHAYVYDLADQWNQLTSLPVVFALWVVRNQSKLDFQKVKAVHQQLLGSRDHLKKDCNHYITLIKKSHQNIPSDLSGYFNQLDFHFHDKCKESLLLYATKLHQLNLLPATTELKYFEI